MEGQKGHFPCLFDTVEKKKLDKCEATFFLAYR